MSLFRRRPDAVEERSTINLSGYAQLWNSYLAYSPVAVGRETALSHAASSACIDTLATSVSALPLDVVRISGESRIPVEPAPSLIARPSAVVAQDVWLYQLMQSMLTDGNAFGLVTSFTRGAYPASIELLDPETVGDRRMDNGVPTVLVGGERHALYPFGDVFHIPGRFVMPGTPFAESPIVRARATIGAAIAARDFGSRFFGDGAHPGAIITSDDENLTAEQAKDIKAAFLNAMRGNREPAVLGSGLTYQQVTVDPEDSQFIDLMRFAVEESCRFWRVPPSMVYAATSGQSVTYANVSQADLAYLKHSLEGHLVRIEGAMSALLPRPQVARFNRNAFLRSDPQTRSEIVDRRLKNKTMSVNQAKALEDELPWSDPTYDEPGIPGGAVVDPASTQPGGTPSGGQDA